MGRETRKLWNGRLPEAVIEKIRERATATGKSQADVVSEAVIGLVSPANGTRETSPRVFGDGSGMMIDLNSHQNQIVIGEGDGDAPELESLGLGPTEAVDLETGEVLEQFERVCMHGQTQCGRRFMSTNPEAFTCIPCAMEGHAAAGDCKLCPGGPDAEVVPVAPVLGFAESGDAACRCVHCGAAFRGKKMATRCRHCAEKGHANVEAKECGKCQEATAA